MKTFLVVLISIVVVVVFLKSENRQRREARQDAYRIAEEKRLLYDISDEMFRKIVMDAAGDMTRLTRLLVRGMQVYASVRSVTEKTEWNFVISFDDGGYITGSYQISSDNNDSNIPKELADNIAFRIWRYYRDKQKAEG